MLEFPDTAFIDWADAFENGAYIPGSAAMPEQWARESLTLREQLATAGRLDADIAYGSDARQIMDIARPAEQSRGLVVIVHGGYWHKFDKSWWTFLASGALARGWSVALPSYRLAPSASIPEITQDIADAVTTASRWGDGPIRVTGHSAGGHLVARMMSEDARLASEVFQRLAHVLPISGLYDLRPLMAHPMNASLQLDLDAAIAESPALHRPLTGVAMTPWVGAEERPEFLRQTRLLCERWGVALPDLQGIYEPGKNHFSVIEGLALADSPLTDCLLYSD